MAAEACRQQYDVFDSYAFLKRYFSSDGNSYNLGRMRHTLRCYHDAFETLPNGLKILDYGSGPVMFATISAARKASEIVLSDYADNNCAALRQWLNRDSVAFDWSPHFSYVVRDLEGKREKEVKERQEQVCKLVKGMVHCDITQEPPIDPEYNQLYDVVISSKAIESAARNLEEYKTYITRLGKMVKPGGIQMMYQVENKSGTYEVGDYAFCNLPVSAELSMKMLKEAGFVDLTVDKFFPDDPHRVFSFVKGTCAK